MRILKYLLLILLLLSIGLTVYIFTQKGNYKVQTSEIIKASRSTVFDYVNDYKNWETFSSMYQNNPNITFDYPASTTGAGGSYSWTGDSGKGSMKTQFVKQNDSLSQKQTLDGNLASVHWKFKDTIGGTKVTYSAKGTIGFVMKVKSFFKGGMNRMLKNEYERTLFNLNKTLDFELKTFSIKTNGVATRPANYFLKQSFNTTAKDLSRNIKIVLPRLVYFFKKNEIPMAGKPFVIYETTSLNAAVFKISVCIPTKQKIAVQEDSDVTSGEMEAFTCIKTTLKGDYSHREKLWTAAQAYLVDKKYLPNASGKYIEIYVKTIDDVKNPSKWETELYIPVYPKAEDVISAPIENTYYEESDSNTKEAPKPTTPTSSSTTTINAVAIPKPTTVQTGTVTPKPRVTTPDTNSQTVIPKKPATKKTDSIKPKLAAPKKPEPAAGETENQ